MLENQNHDELGRKNQLLAEVESKVDSIGYLSDCFTSKSDPDFVPNKDMVELGRLKLHGPNEEYLAKKAQLKEKMDKAAKDPQEGDVIYLPKGIKYRKWEAPPSGVVGASYYESILGDDAFYALDPDGSVDVDGLVLQTNNQIFWWDNSRSYKVIGVTEGGVYRELEDGFADGHKNREKLTNLHLNSELSSMSTGEKIRFGEFKVGNDWHIA